MKRTSLALLLAVALGAGIVFLRPPEDVPGDASGASVPRVEATKRPAPSAALSPAFLEPGPVIMKRERSGLMDGFGSPNASPEQDLKQLQQVLHTSFTALRGAADRINGNNREVTAFLTGGNPERLEFIPREHPAIKDGELVDRWGAAIFFHFVAPGVVEIRSAGPDKKMWNADDLQFPKAEPVKYVH